MEIIEDKTKLGTDKIVKSEKTIEPDLVEENYEIDLEELLGTENHFKTPEIIDGKTGEMINENKGSITKGHFENLSKEGKLNDSEKGAAFIAKTAEKIANNFGKEKGYKLVADNEKYQINLEKDGYLTVTAKDREIDILRVSKLSMTFKYEDKDLDKFKEYSQQLANSKKQDLER